MDRNTKRTDKPATIQDVSELSGISVSTVSRIINNKPHVSKAKRDKVQWAMDQLGYVPMPAARALRGAGTRNVAVCVPNLTNPFFSIVLEGIEQECHNRGYQTLIINTGKVRKRETEALNLLATHHADGLILCDIENEPEVIEKASHHAPIVLCNEYSRNMTLPQVLGGQYDGFFKATDYLAKKGHRRIAYCTGSKTLTLGPKGLCMDNDRYLGFIDALAANQLFFQSDLLFTEHQTIEDGRQLLNKVAKMKNPPTAIISGSDSLSAGFVLESFKKHVRIPEDFAIVGTDDSPIASQLPIELTTISQPSQEIGRRAARLLIDRIENKVDDSALEEGEKEEIILPLDLVIRQSA